MGTASLWGPWQAKWPGWRKPRVQLRNLIHKLTDNTLRKFCTSYNRPETRFPPCLSLQSTPTKGLKSMVFRQKHLRTSWKVSFQVVLHWRLQCGLDQPFRGLCPWETKRHWRSDEVPALAYFLQGQTGPGRLAWLLWGLKKEAAFENYTGVNNDKM